jgi:hypothetical protein
VFDLLERLADAIRATRLLRPATVAFAGAFGVAIARDSVDSAPNIVCACVVVVVVATAYRERGLAVAALGVAATAAFATPAGLGPLLVATGVVIAAHPSTVDRRLAPWPEVVDGLIAVPAFAGLASVAAAQPSQRGAVVAAAATAFLVGTWWRGPRHRVGRPHADTVASYLGALGAAALLLAPDQLDFLGALPSAVATAGRGIAGGLAIVAVACLVQEVRDLRAVSR